MDMFSLILRDIPDKGRTRYCGPDRDNGPDMRIIECSVWTGDSERPIVQRLNDDAGDSGIHRGIRSRPDIQSMVGLPRKISMGDSISIIKIVWGIAPFARIEFHASPVPGIRVTQCCSISIHADGFRCEGRCQKSVSQPDFKIVIPDGENAPWQDRKSVV